MVRRSIDTGTHHSPEETIAWLSDHRTTLTGLRSLDLTRSALTDAGLQHLSAFQTLRELDLSETKITTTGLAVLGRLPELEWLGLRNTGVGLMGRMKLKLKYPKLQVVV